MVFRLENPAVAEELFHSWPETIIWSCLQGVMGHIFADAPVSPRSAMAILGDFRFLAGQVNRELVSLKPSGCNSDFIIMIPQNESWSAVIEETFGCRAEKIVRYAMRKDQTCFDQSTLHSAVSSLPPGYTLERIDERLFFLCRQKNWSRDLVSQFVDFSVYERLGLGIVALHNGIPVSGASSYSRYRDGIEIEVDTSPNHRRQGLAYACAAKLILECIRQGLYPSWDAHNRQSVALAEKLGYQIDHPYPAYEIRGY